MGYAHKAVGHNVIRYTAVRTTALYNTALSCSLRIILQGVEWIHPGTSSIQVITPI